MKTTVFASSRENAYMSTFKLMGCVASLLLFATILTSCNGESEITSKSLSKSLIVDSLSQQGLGWHQFTVTAAASDINGNALAANAEVRYNAEKVVYVDSEEEMGMPVSATTPDGTTFTTNEGNVITRTEKHSASLGATINVAGGEWRGGALGARLNDTTQVCYAYIADNTFLTASNMPEDNNYRKEWRGEKVSVVEYHRVLRKAAPAPVAQYRLRAEFVEVDRGYAYYNIYAEKSVDGGSSWSVMDTYVDFVGMRYGTWKPNVASQVVSSYEFTTNDTTVPMATEETRTGLGDSKNWTINNLSKVEYRWSATFAAPADAEGNTERQINGAQNVWVYGCVYNNPETGEPMELNFSGEAKTVLNKVEGNTYTRTVSLICNGEVIDSQTGSVTLELQ